MSTFFLFLYKLVSRYRLIAVVLLLILLGGSGYYASKLRFAEDISSALPMNEKIGKMNFVFENAKLLEKLVFNIHLADTSITADASRLVSLAGDFTKHLEEQFVPGYFKSIDRAPGRAEMQDMFLFFQDNLPLFLEEEDFDRLQNKTTAESVKSAIDANYKLLISPAGFATKKTILSDPLHLTNIALEKLKAFSLSEDFILQDGFIVSKDGRNVLVLATPVSNSDTKLNKELFTKVDSLISALTGNTNIEVSYFGTSAVALGNAQRIKKDIVITVSLALIILGLAIYLFFRKKRSFVLVFLPAAMGALVAMGFLGAFVHEVSAIALGIGSVLLGISVDYAIHILSHFRQNANLKEVFRDVSTPIAMSSLTTASAFLSLLFINSKALNDLGLFAAVSVLAAAGFSLLVLPHLLGKGATGKTHTPNFIDSLAELQLHTKPWLKVIVVVLTIFFWFSSKDVSFDADMMKNNFMSDKLKQAESDLNSISDVSRKTIYIASPGKSIDDALENNKRAVEIIDSLKTLGIVKSAVTVNDLLKPLSEQKRLISKWENFWDEHYFNTKKRIETEAELHGFKPNTFTAFDSMVTKQYRTGQMLGIDKTFDQIAGNYLIETDTLMAVINLLKVDSKGDDILEVYNAFEGEENLWLVDKRLITSEFMKLLNDNFNKLVLVSMAFVFLILLLAYGRIELSLITMLPVLISWIWTVGIMGLFGISFNIFNTIILTFVFGLGIDYSIFVMRGLLQDYKYGRGGIASYKVSVILSAITTLAGIGVLIFAKHPALKSIALMSIIGIISVVVVNFILLPSIFNWLVSYKKGMRNRPVTLLDFVFSIASLIAFMLGAVIMTALSFVFKIIPANSDKKKLVFHSIFSKFTWFLIYMNFLSKKRIINPQGEDYSEASIIIANHQSHIDLMLMMLLNPKVLVLTNDRNYNNPVYGKALKYADFMPSDEGYENVLKDVEPLIRKGYSLVVYPEGHRNDNGKVKRFHKGAFYLASELGIPIQPIIIHGQNQLLKKSEFFLKRGSITTKFLPKIYLADGKFGNDLKEQTKGVQEYFRKEYAAVRREFETPKYFADYICKNYLYKGPVLEWYTKIKLGIEDNYEVFNNIIPRKCKITDLGCGYGYLAYMLNLVSEERIITAVDYDEQKIAVAANCAINTKDVKFVAADITEFEIEYSDVIIIKDTLHYLPAGKQVRLLEKCISKLNTGGKIIIRDGDREQQKEHKNTKLTEFFSTKFGFNKAEHQLEFIAKSSLEKLASKHNLDFEEIGEARHTSNKLFVLRKT